jgi:hypothetical protein
VLERTAARETALAAVKEVLRQTLLTLDFIRDHRNRLSHELGGRGLEPEGLRGACGMALQAIDILADVYHLLLDLPGEGAQREEVERQAGAAAEIRRSFAGWSEALGRPLPPIDWEKVAEGARADAEAGRMIRVEKYDDLFPSHRDEP